MQTEVYIRAKFLQIYYLSQCLLFARHLAQYRSVGHKLPSFNIEGNAPIDANKN